VIALIVVQKTNKQKKTQKAVLEFYCTGSVQTLITFVFLQYLGLYLFH